MKKIRTLILSIISVLAICGVAYAQKMNLYKNVIEQEIEVTASLLNIRTGPGTDYPVVGSVEKGQILTVIGTLDNWYIVLLPDNSIGVISHMYAKVTKMGESFLIQGANDKSADSEQDENKTDQEKMFDMVNKVRLENNLEPFIWDEKINRIAQIKAQDMLDNNYFEHNSPNYGTPFAMLKQMDVLYKSASENIARNTSIENAHLEIMNSVQHRVNVLNAGYNKMGIGIVANNDWGMIIVQLFVEE